MAKLRSMVKLELSAILAEMFGSADAVPPGAVDGATSVEFETANGHRRSLSRMCARIPIDAAPSTVPDQPVHIVMPCSLLALKFIHSLADKRPVIVEDLARVRGMSELIGHAGNALTFQPLPALLRLAKAASGAEVFVTFPDVRCIDYDFSIVSMFLGKKRHFGLEDCLSLRNEMLAFGVAVVDGTEFVFRKMEKTVAQTADHGASQIVSLYAVCLEQTYANFADTMFSWRECRGLCTDSVQTKRAFVPRLSEGLLMQAMQVGLNPPFAEDLLSQVRKRALTV